HEDARLHRARAGDQPRAAAARRALRGSRRDHSLQAQRGFASTLASASLDGGLRHAQRVRIRVPVEPSGRDDATAGADRGRYAHRSRLSPCRQPAYRAALCRALSRALAPARRRHDDMTDRALRVLGPAAVGVLFLVGWEAVVRYFEIPWY